MSKLAVAKIINLQIKEQRIIIEAELKKNKHFGFD